MTALAPTLQAFFTDRLIRQRNASPHTIAAYRDTLRLLLASPPPAPDRTVSMLDLADLDAPLVAGVPGPPRTRPRQQHPHPQRPARRHPLAVPLRRPGPPRTRRQHRPGPGDPTQALRPGAGQLPHRTRDRRPPRPPATRRTWTGRRDHAMLLLAVQTGLRISELIGLTPADLHLGTGAHVACHGKGRKDRITPLTADTPSPSCGAGSANSTADPTAPLFPSRHGGQLSRDAIERRISALHRASPQQPARRSTTKPSPRTSCGTPPRCGSSTPASTPASSPSGSATSASRPPRSTSTPTSPSRKRPSTEPDRRPAGPADTSRPTHSSPGSKGSDYADLANPNQHLTRSSATTSA